MSSAAPISAAEIGAICFGQRSRAAARAVTRAFNNRFRPLGLSVTQFALLGAIYGDADEPLVALSETLGTEHSAMLRNIKILEGRGLVTGTGGRGRAGRRLRLTEAGRALLRDAYPIWRETQQALEAELGASRTVVDHLLRLEAAASKLADPESPA